MHRFLQFTVRFSSFALLFLLSLSLPAQADEAPSFNRAAFISQQVPNLVTAGQTYTVRITLRNVGTTAWRSIDTHYGYKLGSECPRDNRTWGTNRIYLPQGRVVYPGQYYTFSFEITAPTTGGRQCFQWKMVEEGVEWFDQATPRVYIMVIQPYNRAKFISQNVPAQIRAGETKQVRVTMKNTGTTTWRRENDVFGHKLGSQCPQDNTRWGTNRVFLPPGKEVKPGQTHTFVFDITGPLALGQQCFQWKMVEEGVRWFPDSTPARLIFVHSPSSAQSN